MGLLHLKSASIDGDGISKLFKESSKESRYFILEIIYSAGSPSAQYTDTDTHTLTHTLTHRWFSYTLGCSAFNLFFFWTNVKSEICSLNYERVEDAVGFFCRFSRTILAKIDALIANLKKWPAAIEILINWILESLRQVSLATVNRFDRN